MGRSNEYYSLLTRGHWQIGVRLTMPCRSLRRRFLRSTIALFSFLLGCSTHEDVVTVKTRTETSPIASSVLTFDAGLVHPGDKIVHLFTIVNTSSDRWTVSEIRRGCSCIVTGISEKIVDPGSSVIVEMASTASNHTEDRPLTASVDFDGKQRRPHNRSCSYVARSKPTNCGS